MPQPKDEEIETRAIALADADKLAWVKLPNRAGQPDTPAGATNFERDSYRDEARDQLRQESESLQGNDTLPD